MAARRRKRKWKAGEPGALSHLRKTVRAGYVDAERLRPTAGTVMCRLSGEIMAVLTATAATQSIDETTMVTAIVETWLERYRARRGYGKKSEAILRPTLSAETGAPPNQIMVRLSKGNMETLDGQMRGYAPLTRQKFVRRLVEEWIVSTTQGAAWAGPVGSACEAVKHAVDLEGRRLREPAAVLQGLLPEPKEPES